MKNLYRIRGSKIIVSYLYGELLDVLICGDQIGWDAMRHGIPFLEDDIDKGIFQLVGNGTNK
jgi:hypothetical protein